jgi:hypothetical protein
MRIVILPALGAAMLSYGQQPEIVQTPTDIVIHLNLPDAASGVETRSGAFYGVLPAVGAVKGAPFSAEAVTETTQTLPDGRRATSQSSSTIYRDGMGRERREQTFAVVEIGTQSTASKHVTITDPVSNTAYTLDPRAHSATKAPLLVTLDSGGHLAGPGPVVVSGRMIPGGSPPSVEVKTEDLGSKSIDGVMSNGKRETRTGPAGPIEDETWYSPDLRTTVMSRHSDPRAGQTVYRLTKINRTEPDPLLFQVPPDYKIVETPGLVGKE